MAGLFDCNGLNGDFAFSIYSFLATSSSDSVLRAVLPKGLRRSEYIYTVDFPREEARSESSPYLIRIDSD